MFGFAPLGSLPIGGFPGAQAEAAPEPNEYELTCAAGSYEITGNAIGLALGGSRVIGCTTGTYGVTGVNPDLTRQRTMVLEAPPVLPWTTYGISGLELWLQPGGAILAVSGGPHNITGSDADLLMGRLLTIDIVSVTYEPPIMAAAARFRSTGGDVTMTVTSPTVQAEIGIYTTAGADMTFKRSIVLEAGAFALTGIDPAVVKPLPPLNAELGIYAMSPSAIGFLRTFEMPLEEGAVELTGPDAIVKRGFYAVAELGGYETIGEDVVANREREKQLNLGLYEVNGTAAAARVARILEVEEGAFAITGDDVTFLRGKVIELATGSYALSGAAVGVLRGRSGELEEGELTIDGSDAAITRGRRLVIEGAYAFGEVDVDLVATRRLVLVGGTHVLNGVGLSAQFAREEPGPRLVIPGALPRIVEPGPLPRRLVVGPVESRYLAVPAREQRLAA